MSAFLRASFMTKGYPIDPALQTNMAAESSTLRIRIKQLWQNRRSRYRYQPLTMNSVASGMPSTDLDRCSWQIIAHASCARRRRACSDAGGAAGAGACRRRSPWDERHAFGRPPDRRRAPRRTRRAVARRHRDQAGSRAGKPIGAIRAISGVPPRFDFSGSENLDSATGALSGAAAVHRRGRQFARLQGRRDLPAEVAAEGRRRKPVDAAPQARLRGVREAVRAGARPAPSSR